MRASKLLLVVVAIIASLPLWGVFGLLLLPAAATGLRSLLRGDRAWRN